MKPVNWSLIRSSSSSSPKIQIIQHLLRAGEAASRRVHPRKAHLAAFESFMFLMAITVAHEVVHFFTGFLTGYVLPPTPAEVSFLPSKYNARWNGVELGESGRAWEATLLGGIIEGVEDPSHPLGVYQAGTFYLIDEQNQARRIDRHYVKRFLERSEFIMALLLSVIQDSLLTCSFI